MHYASIGTAAEDRFRCGESRESVRINTYGGKFRYVSNLVQ